MPQEFKRIYGTEKLKCTTQDFKPSPFNISQPRQADIKLDCLTAGAAFYDSRRPKLVRTNLYLWKVLYNTTVI